MSFQHDLFIYTISRTAAGSNQSYSLGRTIRWIQDLSTPLFLPLLFPPVLLFFFFSRVAIPPVDQQMAAFPHQTTAQLQRDWDTFNNTKQKKKKRSFDVFAVRLCLKTYCCFTVEGLLLFHTHTHIWMCLLFHLTTSPISHLGSAPPPWGRTLNYISMTSFFFFFFFHLINCICECDDTRAHVSMTCLHILWKAKQIESRRRVFDPLGFPYTLTCKSVHTCLCYTRDVSFFHWMICIY